MNSIGVINLASVDTKNGFRLIRELINKCEEDKLNVKTEEFKAVLELVDELDKRTINIDEDRKKALMLDESIKLMTKPMLEKLLMGSF